MLVHQRVMGIFFCTLVDKPHYALLKYEKKLNQLTELWDHIMNMGSHRIIKSVGDCESALFRYVFQYITCSDSS